MPKWWKSNKSKPIPMNTSDDPTISSPKKKTRSLVSFFLDKQKVSDINEQDPTLTYYRGESSIPKQWRTTQPIPYPNLKSPIYYDAQNQVYRYFQLFDDLIDENNSCFGFSLSHITSKYCLYMTIIIFLGICLIISLTAIFKK